MAFDKVIVNKEIDSIPVKPTQMNKMFLLHTISLGVIVFLLICDLIHYNNTRFCLNKKSWCFFALSYHM